MSNKAMALALGALVLAIGAALILTRSPGGPGRMGGSGGAGARESLLGFEASQVVALEVTPADQRPSAARRALRGETGEWRILWRPAGTKAEAIEWPALVPPDALSAIARIGSLEREPARPAAESPTAAVLRFELRDGSAHTVEVLSGSLGGYSLVRIPPDRPGEEARYGRIETPLAEALVKPGPGSWRVRRAATGARDASRVSITGPGVEISLARLDSRWSMRRPVAARADQAAVTALLGALAAAPVERFEEGAPADAASTGLAEPALVINWEIDEREPAQPASPDSPVRVRTHARSLRIGGPADAQGSWRFASADEAGAALMVIPASALASISTAARNYLAPTIAGVRPDDVFLVTVRNLSDPAASAEGGDGERVYRRDLGTWITLAPDGSHAPADGAAVDAALDFLATRPGEPEPAKAGGETSGIREVVRVDLFDLDGDPLEVIIGGYDADGTPSFRAGNLVVRYPGIEPPALLAMPAFAELPAPPDAPPPVKLPEGSPVGK